MTSVSIIAATFHGNKGAEAMLSTTVGRLRESGAVDEFHVFTYYPARDQLLVSDPQIKFHSSTPLYLVTVLNPFAFLYGLASLLRLRFLLPIFPASVRALAKSKCLICLAGVSFVDGREKFVAFNIATLLPAVFVGTPVVKMSQALGTFKNPINRAAAKVFLPRLRRCFTRGDRTHNHLVELFGPNPTFERANDAAFLFNASYGLSRSEAPELEPRLAQLGDLSAQTKGIVGICPSVVVERKAAKNKIDYVAIIADLVSHAVVNGYAVAIFPNAVRGDDPTAEHNNDLPLVNKIMDRLNEATRKLVVAFDLSVNAAEIHRIIGASDILAVSRFHAMIGALAHEKPSLVMGWSHKYLEVMELFEQGDMVVDYEHNHGELVTAALSQLFETQKDRRRTISKCLSAVKDGSIRQFEYLNTLITNG